MLTRCTVYALSVLLFATLGLGSPLDFDLPSVLSDPDERNDSSDPINSPRRAGEHGRMLSSESSEITKELGKVEVKEWELQHGFVADAVGDKNALSEPNGWKKAPLINTDVALRQRLDPFDYATLKNEAAMHDEDMIGARKFVDSTVPSDSDPANIDGAPLYNPGDPRDAMRALYPNPRVRGMGDPEAKEILKRNSKLVIPLDIITAPMHKEIKLPTFKDGTTDWDSMVSGMQDTSLTRVTDPAILEAQKGKGLVNTEAFSSVDAREEDPQSSPHPDGTKDTILRDIPTFDVGMHRHEGAEFFNPKYRGLLVRSRRAALRRSTETPFSERHSNYEGLMMTEPPVNVPTEARKVTRPT